MYLPKSMVVEQEIEKENFWKNKKKENREPNNLEK